MLAVLSCDWREGLSRSLEALGMQFAKIVL
jgi:hypothetical protein